MKEKIVVVEDQESSMQQTLPAIRHRAMMPPLLSFQTRSRLNGSLFKNLKKELNTKDITVKVYDSRSQDNVCDTRLHSKDSCK
jgi:hypothetical protein